MPEQFVGMFACVFHSFILCLDTQMHEKRHAGNRSIYPACSKTVVSAKSESVETGNKAFV